MRTAQLKFATRGQRLERSRARLSARDAPLSLFRAGRPVQVFDTQLIVGCSPTGKPHQFAFTPDDYIMAALQIYLDIINLFILILSLLGDRK